MKASGKSGYQVSSSAEILSQTSSSVVKMLAFRSKGQRFESPEVQVSKPSNSLGYEPSTVSVAGTSLTLVRVAAVPNADKVTLVPCHTLSYSIYSLYDCLDLAF